MKKIKKSIMLFFAAPLSLAAILQNAPTSEAINEEIHVMTDEDFIPIYEEYIGTEHSELLDKGYYIDNGYDLIYDFKGEDYGNEELRWWRETDEDTNTLRLYFDDAHYVAGIMIMPSCRDLTVRIPDTVNGITVTEFYRSGAFKAFDVNPENEYFQSDGQTVFSKDKKTLLSYAQFNESKHYSIPKGTRTIRKCAFSNCDILESIYIPSSVTEIEPYAFEYMNALKSITFESWDKSKIKIDKSIWGSKYYDQSELKLTCSTAIETFAVNNKINWKPVSGASYYEIYQKLSSGEYKLLKATKLTSCKFPSLKSGKTYTFAIKPMAVIPAANYNEEEDKEYFPESFTIEGTMSEDIVLTGK